MNFESEVDLFSWSSEINYRVCLHFNRMYKIEYLKIIFLFQYTWISESDFTLIHLFIYYDNTEPRKREINTQKNSFSFGEDSMGPQTSSNWNSNLQAKIQNNFCFDLLDFRVRYITLSLAQPIINRFAPSLRLNLHFCS